MCFKETPASEYSSKDRCATKSLHFCVAKRQIPRKFVLAQALHSPGTHGPFLLQKQALCFLGLGAQDLSIRTVEERRTKLYSCSWPCMHSFFCVLHVEFSGTQTSVHFPGCMNLCLNDFQFSRKQPKLIQFWRKTTKCHVCRKGFLHKKTSCYPLLTLVVIS